MEPGKYQLAASTATAPTSFSYWVAENQLLAGAYPGDPDPTEHREKVHALLAAGVRAFLNLMEEDETNNAGEPFVPYADLARQAGPEVVCVRCPILDLSVPTAREMHNILDTVDQHLEAGRSVYVHCWGGVGRTGTVVGCWLLRHRLAEPSNVLDVIMWLRQQDRERGRRMSPETPSQQRFVKAWQG